MEEEQIILKITHDRPANLDQLIQLQLQICYSSGSYIDSLRVTQYNTPQGTPLTVTSEEFYAAVRKYLQPEYADTLETELRKSINNDIPIADACNLILHDNPSYLRRFLPK